MRIKNLKVFIKVPKSKKSTSKKTTKNQYLLEWTPITFLPTNKPKIAVTQKIIIKATAPFLVITRRFLLLVPVIQNYNVAKVITYY